MGNRLHEIIIDPQTGGRTVFNNDEPVVAPLQPVVCYWAAMVGSALLGSLLVFCGFNTLASKIASFFIGLSFAAVSAVSMSDNWRCILIYGSSNRSYGIPAESSHWALLQLG